MKARRPVREWYPRDDSPIAGLLAFGISRVGSLLLGSMSTPSGDYLTPIQPEAISAAETLPVGSLIARRGWISKFGYRAICPEVPPRLDPNADGGLGSPFVHCPGVWMTAEQVTVVDPSDPLAPAGFGISVQPLAFEWFKRDMPVVQPATCLLRRVTNPLEGALPRLGWQAVGRLDAADTDARTDPPGIEQAA